jgi:hypothetical protein
VPDQFATAEEHLQSSSAQATPKTTASLCRLPEHLKRKLGTKSYSLATAALLHFSFVPSLLHIKKRIFKHRHQTNPHHARNQLPAKPAPRIDPRRGFGLSPAGWADVPRRSGRRPPAHRLSTIVNVRREPQPAPSPKESRLQTFYVVKPVRPAGRSPAVPAYFAPADLTSP